MNTFEKLDEIISIYPRLLRGIVDYVRNDSVSKEIQLKNYKIQNTENYLWSWNDLLLYIDNPSSSRSDSLFPPHPESIFLSNLIASPFGTGKFLDIGIGSGILSIIAAKAGWKVTGIDVNPRAIKFGHINAALNSVEIDIIKGHLTEPCKANDYQLCIANLPFEPTPELYKNFIHSDGGIYGDKLIQEFLFNLNNLMSENGIIIIPAFTLIKENKSRLEDIIEDKCLDEFERVIIRLSDPIDLKYLSYRYGKKKSSEVFSSLIKEDYKSFCIDLAVLKKIKHGSSFKGIIEYKIAGNNWILPAKWDGIAKCKN